MELLITSLCFVFGTIGIVGLILIPVYLLRAYVLVKLWAWFMVPLGIFEIGYAHAIGISLVVGFLTSQYIPAKDKDNKWAAAAHTFLTPIMVLFIGWITTKFM
jgi:hypothetical protein